MTETNVTSQKRPQATKRKMIEEARDVALTGDWEQSLAVDEQFLERFPRDPEALNRRGRALLELGKYQESWAAYSEALSADPANMIARRNLQRLEMLASSDVERDIPDEPIPSSRAGAFVEEIGKTWVDELTKAVDDPVLAAVSPGEQLQFETKDVRVTVLSRSGVQLGELEQRIAQRLIDLINAGNRYEMYALGMSGHSLRFILREVYRDPSTTGQMGLPRQNRATTDLMRERELLSQREEADFSFGEDEDVAEEEAEAPDDDAEEEREIDEEAASYVDTSTTGEDTDDQM